MKTIKKIFAVLFVFTFLGVSTPAISQNNDADTTKTVDDNDDDDSGKMGLLGLLGLAGLLGLRRKDDDRNRTTTVRRD